MLKHGMSHSREYTTWEQMLSRCTNPRTTHYRKYGGRGIKVCERWRTFENFYADMGPRPLGMSLDRIDVDGDYAPENCRWADAKTQQRNRTNNKVFEYQGECATLPALCERLGVNVKTARNRLAAGASIAIALTKGRVPRNTIKVGN